MAAERIVSADSHVVEPADVWTARIEPRFADRAPPVIRKEGRGERLSACRLHVAQFA